MVKMPVHKIGDLSSDKNFSLNNYHLYDSMYKIFNIKDYLSQLLNIYKDNDVEEIKIQTAEPLIPEPTLLEVEIALEKLKKYKSPGIYEIPAKLKQDYGNTLLTESIKLCLLFGKRKCYQNNGRNP